MNAGELRTRARLQRRPLPTDGASDGQGGTTAPDFIDMGTYWVNIAPVRGMEGFAQGRQNPDVTHAVTVRYRRGVTAAHRVLVAPSRVFDIQSVIDENERHEWLVLECKEYAV